jgi:hypothetical protein
VRLGLRRLVVVTARVRAGEEVALGRGRGEERAAACREREGER